MNNICVFKRALIVERAKKNYATIQELQEGNMIPQKESTALDIKGIPCMTNATSSKSIREELKHIMYNDILKPEKISQSKVIEDMAIVQKKIENSIRNGEKLFYRPATVKAKGVYVDPMRVQGVKAIIVWNKLKPEGYKSIDIDTRNSIDIAKININNKNIEAIQNEEIREKARELLGTIGFKDEITCIAIPRDTDTPNWVMELIDYDTIIKDNISGFPLESIGCMRNDNRNVTWSNMLQL